MPMTFDLDDIEISLREPALHDLLGQIPVPIDVSTGAVDRLHVSTVSDFFGRLFLVSCNGRGALVHRGQRRVAQDHQRTMLLLPGVGQCHAHDVLVRKVDVPRP